MAQENNNLELILKALENDSASKKIDLTMFDKYKRQIDTTQISNRFEVFNSQAEIFRNEKLNIKREVFSSEQEQMGKNTYRLDQYDDENGVHCVRAIKFTRSSIIILEKIDSHFHYIETYYLNGNMSEKFIVSGGFEIGKHYKFDEEGVLTEVIDTDEGYTFTYKDVCLFLEKEGLKHMARAISKTMPGDIDIKIWNISVFTFRGCINYILDAANGNVIRKIDSPESIEDCINVVPIYTKNLPFIRVLTY